MELQFNSLHKTGNGVLGFRESEMLLDPTATQTTQPLF